MAYRKVCKPYYQGGLGIRFASLVNKAYNLKLYWDLLNSNEDWALLLKVMVVKNGSLIHHHISSSIWSNIKEEQNEISSDTYILIGNGRNTIFWLEPWCRPTLMSDIFWLEP